jgi:hypothetical protein
VTAPIANALTQFPSLFVIELIEHPNLVHHGKVNYSLLTLQLPNCPRTVVSRNSINCGQYQLKKLPQTRFSAVYIVQIFVRIESDIYPAD